MTYVPVKCFSAEDLFLWAWLVQASLLPPPTPFTVRAWHLLVAFPYYTGASMAVNKEHYRALELKKKKNNCFGEIVILRFHNPQNYCCCLLLHHLIYICKISHKFCICSYSSRFPLQTSWFWCHLKKGRGEGGWAFFVNRCQTDKMHFNCIVKSNEFLKCIWHLTCSFGTTVT